MKKDFDSKKTYILDTNILLQSPYSIYAFDEHDVVLADVTLEELDIMKSSPGQKGFHTREVSRILKETINYENTKKQENGVNLPGGGKLIIEMGYHNIELPYSWKMDKADNRILQICKGIIEKGGNPILVTNDILMSIKANIIEIKTEQYKSEQMSELNAQYTGRCTVLVKSTALDDFYRNKELDMESIIETQERDNEFMRNEFALLVDVENNQHTALARFNGKTFVPLRHEMKCPYNVKPRNIGQKFAQEALLSGIESAPLVILKGAAGTAKTFYALATGLAQTLENNGDSFFDRILVARPNVKFDEDIGYLKGGENEKIEPLIRPIIDNLEQLTRTTSENKDGCITNSYVQDLFDKEIITAQALAYMRGRSITNTWIIIDEAQNMTPAQAFGIISRAGIGSKIILVGDPEQIDNPHLDSRTNGLSYAAEKMKGSPLCWQVTFEDDECVRSALSKEAIKRLQPKGMEYN